MIMELPYYNPETDEYDDTVKEIEWGMRQIMDVRKFTRSNFSGYWELAWLPFSGGYLEQPLELMEHIETVIGIVNKIKSEKDKEKGGK